MYFRLDMEPVPYDCFFVPDKVYTLTQSIVVYYIPVVFMLVFYTQCLVGLKRQYRKINAALAANNLGGKAVEPDNSLSIIGDTPSVYPHSDEISGYPAVTTTSRVTESQPSTNHQSTQHGPKRLQRKSRRRQEHSRSIRTLGVIIIIFLVCWLPFCIFWPVVAYCPDCIPAKWYEYSYWSAYLNSTINPLLYFLSNKDFRAAFKKLIHKK
jgi:hypothetical protein